MKKIGLLISLLFFLAACGGSPKQVSTSKSGKKSNHAKKSSQKYVPHLGEDASLEDIIYDSLGHKQGSGVRFSKYIEQNGKFDIPVVYNDAVMKWVDYFTGKGRGHFERYVSRSGRFIPYMHSVLVQYNLPKDLVYLSMIESGFNTRAMSWAAAGGLWQFIRSTGSMYGLSGDYYVDERADPEKATHAAARHLKDLYDEFGDWYLAFGAYNAGAGKIRNAISRHGTDFWDMAQGSYLRQETKDYVPKLLAAAIIAKNPRKYGFSEVEYQLPIDYERVQMKSPTDLEVAAECSGVDPDLIRLLNPELLRDMTPPHVTNYALKIPRGTRDRFMRKYLAMSPANRMRTTFYTVQRGDTVREIAGSYGVSEKDLVAGNEGRIDVDRDRRSKVERVAVRKGKKVKHVKKKVTYTVVSYDVEPGTVLAIPKNRGVARNASSRDDVAAHAAKRQYGLRMASAEEVDVKGKKKKDKKKPAVEKQIAQAELPPLEEVAVAPAPAAPRTPAPSDLDDTVMSGDPGYRGETKFGAASNPPSDAGSAGTPLAMNDRPSDLSTAPGTPVAPSDADLKAAVEGLKPGPDEPAAPGTQTASADKSWVPEQDSQGSDLSPEPAAPAPAKPKKSVYHLVKSGETLTSIAERYDVSVTDLKGWNGKKVVPYPRKGTKILVKTATPAAKTTIAQKSPAKAPVKVAKKTAKPQKAAILKYKVKPGDSLIKIAKQHATTPDKIQRLNGMKGTKIVPGVVLVVGSK